MAREYREPIPDYAEVMPVGEWYELVSVGGFTPDDGHGHWVKDEKMSREDDPFETAPEDATHIAWFNK